MEKSPTKAVIDGEYAALPKPAKAFTAKSKARLLARGKRKETRVVKAAPRSIKRRRPNLSETKPKGIARVEARSMKTEEIKPTPSMDIPMSWA